MKLEDLAIIFIIIILPMAIILSAYVGNNVDTLKTQNLYNQKLINSTYDAVLAYQNNTLNSSTSNLTMSKLRDIEASANAFFISLGENFKLAGHGKNSIKEFVPALVFTMYDGYYIYSKYDNKLDEEAKENIKQNNSPDKDGEQLTGLKPYIYYSCAYKNNDCDVVINYSLDSYITITGKVDGEVLNLKGYLLSSAKKINNNTAKYREVEIKPEKNLEEKVLVFDDNEELVGKEKNYIFPVKKINGVKYYQYENKVFTNINSKQNIQSRVNNIGNQNIQALKYYIQSSDLKDKILNSSLKDLRIKDAINKPKDEDENNIYSNENEKVFKELENGINQTQIEDENSNFNLHRFEVIKHSIEKNLSVIISNYNKISNNITSDFKLPKLKDYEWENVLNNISIISFLQGLPIKGKIYNGHAIINNSENEEFVSKESIYIVDENKKEYHNIRDIENLKNKNNLKGYLNIDFKIKNNQGGYFIPRYNSLGCYKCIVSSENNKSGEIDKLIKNYDTIKKAYYTALGRERYSMYRIENR